MAIKTPDADMSRYWVPILGATARILDLFYESDSELSLQQISATAKVGKTSAFRILYTLDRLGYVEKNDSTGRYRLGLRIIAAARATLANGGLVQIARRHLSRLHDEFHETVNLAILEKDHITYIEILESPLPFRVAETVGARVPWHSTALGKSIAAFLPEPQVKAILARAPLERLTSNTITTVRGFLEALVDVRAQGYSMDSEESQLGATCIAAPIFDGGNGIAGALSLSGPTPRIEDNRTNIINEIKQAATAITRSLKTGSSASET